MHLGLSLGLSAPARTDGGGALSDQLYLAVGGDSLALRFVSNSGNLAKAVSEGEAYYGSGNVTIEGFAQGGLATMNTWANANGATSVYFWDDTTSQPAAKLTGLISSGITTPADVNAVMLFLGTNDADATLQAGFGSTYTKAQYKTAVQELCENLYNIQFPNASFIGIVPFHRNDQTDFAGDVYQAVMESWQESADEVSYIKLLPSIWDVDLADTVHPTGEEDASPSTAAYQGVIAPRMMDAIATLHSKTAGALTGPSMATATLEADHILVDITHDKGTDLTVPASAENGLAVTDDGATLTIDGVMKVDTDTIKIDLPDQGLNTGSTYKVFASYKQTEALARTSAEVITDNATNAAALVQGQITVTENDPVRKLTNLVVDMNARGGIKSVSGSDVTAISCSTGQRLISATGRYPHYDDTAFGGAGALFAPDTTTHMLNDTGFTASAAGLLGIVVDIPAGAGNHDIMILGTGSTGNSATRLRYESAGDKLRWRTNQSNFAETLKEGGVAGHKHVILMNFISEDSCAYYINDTSVTGSFDPRNQVANQNRVWFWSQTASNTTAANLKIARAFYCNAAHDGVNDPSIATLMSYLNDTYNVGVGG